MIINQLNALIGRMNANEHGSICIKLHDCSLAFTPGISLKIDKDYRCVTIIRDPECYVIPIDKIIYIWYKDENEDSTLDSVKSSKQIIDKV